MKQMHAILAAPTAEAIYLEVNNPSKKDGFELLRYLLGENESNRYPLVIIDVAYRATRLLDNGDGKHNSPPLNVRLIDCITDPTIAVPSINGVKYKALTQFEAIVAQAQKMLDTGLGTGQRKGTIIFSNAASFLLYMENNTRVNALRSLCEDTLAKGHSVVVVGSPAEKEQFYKHKPINLTIKKVSLKNPEN